MRPEDVLACRLKNIVLRIHEAESKAVVDTEVRLGKDPLERHGFPAIPIVDACGGLLMDMDDLSVGSVNHLLALGLSPLRPSYILKTGQHFVIGMLLPQASSNRGIGVVAKRTRLVPYICIRKPLLKDPALRVPGAFGAALFAIHHRDAWRLERRQQALKPIGIYGVNMRAGNHDELRCCGLDPEIKRTSKSELVRSNMYEAGAIRLSNLHRGVRGARVDNNNLNIFQALTADALQQTSEVLGFVVGANDNRALHNPVSIVSEMEIRDGWAARTANDQEQQSLPEVLTLLDGPDLPAMPILAMGPFHMDGTVVPHRKSVRRRPETRSWEDEVGAML